MRRYFVCLAAAMSALFASVSAQAAISDCTQKEYDTADQSVGWGVADDHYLFTTPQLTYNRPLTGRLGLDLAFVVGADGHIQCLENPGWVRKALLATPERMMVQKAMEGWRFKPFEVDGKPVRAVVPVFIPEKVDFHYHEDMPSGSLNRTHIQLSRTGCFGPCPSYRITLHGNGQVEYEGLGNVDVKGLHTYTISPGAVAALIERLRSRDVWSMAGSWIAPITDNPGYKTTITIGGQTRIIYDYVGENVGMPEVVTASENDIDLTAGTAGWLTLSSKAVRILEAGHFSFRSQAGADLLARAVSNGEGHDDAAMLRLIELGAPIEGAQKSKNSYLEWLNPSLLDAALENARNVLVEPLIARGALQTSGKLDMSKVNSAFQSAVAGGRLALVQRIWDVAGNGMHPDLTFADKDEDADDDKPVIKQSPVTLLLKKRASDTHWEGLEIAKWLAVQGCDLKAVDASGDTLMSFAVEADDIGMVKYLLSQGLSASAPGRYGDSALGSVDTDEDMAMLLIENGADPWALNSDHYDFMAFAKDKNWTRVLAWMEAHKPEKP